MHHASCPGSLPFIFGPLERATVIMHACMSQLKNQPRTTYLATHPRGRMMTECHNAIEPSPGAKFHAGRGRRRSLISVGYLRCNEARRHMGLTWTPARHLTYSEKPKGIFFQVFFFFENGRQCQTDIDSG